MVSGFTAGMPTSSSYQLPNGLRLSYSIQPTRSLVSSSQLIADYMADKIEQSVSIQQLFNELLRFFETEAECLGPAFNMGTAAGAATFPARMDAAAAKPQLSTTSGESKMYDKEGQSPIDSLPKILGFRIVCSGRLQMSTFSKPAEKAESIVITRGVLPLNTMKANIDFAQAYSTNAYGTCGIKV